MNAASMCDAAFSDSLAVYTGLFSMPLHRRVEQIRPHRCSICTGRRSVAVWQSYSPIILQRRLSLCLIDPRATRSFAGSLRESKPLIPTDTGRVNFYTKRVVEHFRKTLLAKGDEDEEILPTFLASLVLCI